MNNPATRTNHGASVPLPRPNHWTLFPEARCRRCAKMGALRYYEIASSDHGDEVWECAKEFGGCGDRFVSEGADS
jgi:hypothetical protein